MDPDQTHEPVAGYVLDAFWRSSAGLAVTTIDGRIVAVNDALCALLGRTREEMTGAYWDEGLIEDAAADRHHSDRLIAGEISGFHRTAVLRHADGSAVRVIIAVALSRSEDGVPRHLVSSILEAAGSERVDQELRTLADVDALTGVFNRRRFDYELERLLYHGRRHGTPTALLMVDVDGLKAVNDTHGHLAGDDLLVAVARILQSRLRLSDVAARIGGDEFAILLPDADRRAAERVAADLAAAVRAQPVMVDGAPVSASITVGIACATGSEDERGRSLVRRADEALYAARGRRGRPPRRVSR